MIRGAQAFPHPQSSFGPQDRFQQEQQRQIDTGIGSASNGFNPSGTNRTMMHAGFQQQSPGKEPPFVLYPPCTALHTSHARPAPKLWLITLALQ